MTRDVYNIPKNITKLTTEFDNIHSHKSHIVFAHLYKAVTEEWIIYADKTESRELILFIIERFYQKYQKYVINNIYQPDNNRTADHWHIYFELIDKRDPFQNLAHFFELVYASAFAHTRYDLAEAIEETLLAHPEVCSDVHQLAQLKTDLIGVATNQVFQTASKNYLYSIVQAMGENRPKGMGGFCHLNFSLIQSIWIKKFQHWRNLAWQDAIRTCVQQ